MGNKLSPDMPVLKRQFAQRATHSAPIKAPRARPKAHAKAKAAQARAPRRNPDGRQVAPGLTAGQLKRLTGAAVGQKYGGAEHQLAAQPARINNWYTQYQDTIQNAKDQGDASYANAVQGVSNLQTGLDDSSRQQWAGQQGQMSADAANRGASTDPTLADQVHNASSVRNMLTGSFGAQLLGQGAAQSAFMGNRVGTAGQQRVEALGANAQQMQQLKRDKGSFAQTFRQDAIDTASKNYLNNALAAASLGQKAVQTQATRATIQKTKAETTSTTLKNRFLAKYGRLPSSSDSNTPSAQLDQWRLNYARQHGHLPSTGARPSSGPGSAKDPYGNTPKQQAASTSSFRKIMTDVEGFAQHIPGFDVMSHSAQAKALYSAVAPDYTSVNVDIINGAIQQAVYRHVGPRVARALKKAGVDSTYWKGR